MAELRLTLLPKTFFLVRLPATDGVPRQILEQLAQGESDAGFISVTRNTEEISYVTDSYPEDLKESTEPSQWRCIKINGKSLRGYLRPYATDTERYIGPLPHHLTGILHDFSGPLKAAKVPIFAISTWDTDWVLVPIDLVDKAKQALEESGWVFVD